jgi:hypothetical protein
VWKADHYFRPEEQNRRLLVALFERMKQEVLARQTTMADSQ